MIGFILNIPYTLIGLLLASVSLPSRVGFRKSPYAFVFNVKSLWWLVGYMNGARGVTIGHAVILGPDVQDKDLEHELVHVEQHQRAPFIQPILYYVELIRKGYRNNKYEEETYRRAGNIFNNKKE
jgi:hypothetical protein